ncbi:MAG: TRAP transporter substrate-binding protein DctP [Clostridiales Family XIII bacterium]|jgi:TRAP-type C4-dicarboxylate transport system substrate-binding protein|nr:TRAP transporter substrate-binding protein DctP [Clostridiales Family XIII bacterium]
MSKSKCIFSSVALIAVLFALAACGVASTVSEPPASTEQPAGDPVETAYETPEFTLKFANSWNTGENWENVQLKKVVEMTKELTNGRVAIEIVGGPELFPPTETAQAVADGLVDGCMTTCGYYAGLVPEAYAMSGAVTNAELAKREGAIEALQDAHAQHNLHVWFFLEEEYEPYVIFTKKQVANLDDLAGLRLRTPAGVCSAIATELKATPVTLPQSDVYSALEQNLIDGIVTSGLQVAFQSHFNFLKCGVLPGFLRGGLDYLINEDVWNSFPDDLKVTMNEISLEINAELARMDKERFEETYVILEEEGGTAVTLSDEDNARLQQMAYDAAWNHTIQQNPEKGEMLKELLG